MNCTIGHREADLGLCFCIYAKPWFSHDMAQLQCKFENNPKITGEQIRCVFDDNYEIISSLKPMVWVLDRIALIRRF